MTLALSPKAPITGSVGATEPVVRVRGLAKSFGTNAVLQSVDLDVRQGAATALIGANGSGKSTLLKCLIRLVEPDAGSIHVMGQNITGLRAGDLRRFRCGVGVVWQRHNLVPRLSALSNVVHGGQSRHSGPRSWYQAIAGKLVRDEALDCLARVGLRDRALERVESLSGGQQQRVAIARMLMQKPGIILADEPDASLDPQTGEDVMRLLSALAREEGLTLILITHRMEHTLAFSDRVLGLQGGTIVMDMPSVATDAQMLRQFFDNREG